jgi:hypothetical protein
MSLKFIFWSHALTLRQKTWVLLALGTLPSKKSKMATRYQSKRGSAMLAAIDTGYRTDEIQASITNSQLYMTLTYSFYFYIVIPPLN